MTEVEGNGAVPLAEAKEYEREFATAVAHAEQLGRQIEAAGQQLAALRDARQQVIGRIGLLQELRGERPPLPAPTEDVI